MKHINWGKWAVILIDVALAVYLVFAFTVFNKPDETDQVCRKVNISIQDETTDGFLNATEIKKRLESAKVYPLSKPLSQVDARRIEALLKKSPFVKTAECYKTQDGQVCVTLTQRTPIVRIKSDSSGDYYIDDNDCIMPNSHYTSDLIIATGDISKTFARQYVSVLSKWLMADDFWKNQIEQINVLPGHGIELVPRVGNHVVYIGEIPVTGNARKRTKEIQDFLSGKLDRLEKFYRYGLSEAGWNKYAYINLEFDNQIICKKSADVR